MNPFLYPTVARSRHACRRKPWQPPVRASGGARGGLPSQAAASRAVAASADAASGNAPGDRVASAAVARANAAAIGNAAGADAANTATVRREPSVVGRRGALRHASLRLVRSRHRGATAAGAALTALMLGLATMASTSAWALDVNGASAQQLDGLKGIGPKTAEQIVAERQRGGPYESLQDLGERIRGLGAKRLQTLEAAGLTAGTAGTAGTAAAPAPQATAPKRAGPAAAAAAPPRNRPPQPAGGRSRSAMDAAR